jgi:hypothetical protein
MRATTRYAATLLCATVVLAGAAAQSTSDTIKRVQDHWMRCLKSSFQIHRKRTPDPNAAAEMAFRACATEEEELWSISAAAGVPRTSFNHLKTAVKQVLIEGK